MTNTTPEQPTPEPRRERIDLDADRQASVRSDARVQPVAEPVLVEPARVEPARVEPDERQIAHDERDLRHDIVAREKEQFGGFKFGSAFFGWLTATGTAVLLIALVSAIGAAIGLGNGVDADEAGDAAAQNAEAVGWVGAISLLVILFVAFLAGGYVAGRMARFSGAKQGIAVWIWAVVIAIVVAIVAAIAGSQFDLFGSFSGFPELPLGGEELTVAGVITLVLVAVVSLVGAILGGLAGMRFHRKVDRAGLTGMSRTV
jgi:hypothetical protein